MNHTIPAVLRARRGVLAALFACALTHAAAAQSEMQPVPAAESPTAPAPAPTATLETGPEATELQLGAFSYGDSPDSVPAELDEIYTTRAGMFKIPVVDDALDAVVKATLDLQDSTGLRIASAYTMVFQQATGGPGTRYGSSGDFDLFGDWTLIGRGTANSGRLVFGGEYRHRIGEQPASALRGEIGSLQSTISGFNDRGWSLRDLYWIQNLFDGKLRLGFGRADSSDFVGGHRLGNLNASFFNRAFASNTTTNFPGHGMTAGASFRPTNWFYITGGAANAYGVTTQSDLSDLDEGDFFSFGEVGFTPTIEGLGFGRYRAMAWHSDAREKDNVGSDRGFSIILEQDLGEIVQVFARYGYADKGLAGIRSSFETGVGVRGLLGDNDNMTGAAFAYSEPPPGNSREEKIAEVFHRWQLTRYVQFSVSAQAIFDPSNAPDDDVLGVFSARLRLAF